MAFNAARAVVAKYRQTRAERNVDLFRGGRGECSGDGAVSPRGRQKRPEEGDWREGSALVRVEEPAGSPYTFK
jgi:hypothetical protein